jgi:hypothetical protein
MTPELLTFVRVCPYVAVVTLDSEAPCTLLTGDGATWHVMAGVRTRCGLNPTQWSTVLAWRRTPAQPRICGDCQGSAAVGADFGDHRQL